MEFYTNVATWGDEVLVRGYDADGKRATERVRYQPTLYLPSRDATGWTTVDGRNVKPFRFKTLRQAWERLRMEQEMHQQTLCGMDNFRLAYIADRWPEAPSVSLSQLVVANLDIEVYAPDGFPDVEKALNEINAITVQWGEKIVTFARFEFTTTDPNIHYVRCTSETQLLKRFLTYWEQRLDPDILTGWSVIAFDIPYMVNRIRRVLGELWVSKLSPWGIIKQRTRMGANGFKIDTYDLYGIACIDYLEAYRKFRLKNRESYRLDYIGHVELDLRKLDYGEYDSLAHLADVDPQKFIEYNIRDTIIVGKLDDKLGFLTLITSLAYHAGVNYEDVFQQTRVWDGIMNRFLAKRNVVMPPSQRFSKENQIAGAYVMPPVPSRYDWVVSFDAASLYPNTLIALNLGAETIRAQSYGTPIIDHVLAREPVNKEENLALAANGFSFSKTTKSYLAQAVQGVLDGRKVEKKKMLDAEAEIERLKIQGGHEARIAELEIVVARANTLQSVYKVCANSAYGTMASPFFRFFDTKIAEAITMTGQLLIQWVRDRVNEALTEKLGTRTGGYVIASDTDSVYVTLDRVPDASEETVKAFADTVLVDAINKASRELESILNITDSRWSFKREVIADRGVWTAKKRYILNILHNEAGRLTEPEIKIVGIEAVRSTTPEWARDHIKSCLKRVLREDEASVQEYIKKVRSEFLALPPEDIALPTSVSSLDTYVISMEEGTYAEKTPIHVRASIYYNQLLMEKRECRGKYPAIRQGDKMRYVFLLSPNPAHLDVMGFPTVLPREFGLHDFIDKDRCFERAFLSPVVKILTAIGWSPVKRRTLERFFA